MPIAAHRQYPGSIRAVSDAGLKLRSYRLVRHIFSRARGQEAQEPGIVFGTDPEPLSVCMRRTRGCRLSWGNAGPGYPGERARDGTYRVIWDTWGRGEGRMGSEQGARGGGIRG